MEYPLMCVLLLALLNISTAQVLIPSINPIAVGNNVTFKLIPHILIDTGTWMFGTNLILLLAKGNAVISPAYTNRILFDNDTSALTLMSVRKNDSGQYILDGIIPNLRSTVSLLVQEPISTVKVIQAGEPPIQNKNFTLNCTVTGPADSMHWIRNGFPLYPENRIVFSADNASLTFNPIQPSDDGDYQCIARNAVSNRTSSGFKIVVNYGPEQAIITGPTSSSEGSNVTFSCSASSQPPSHYSWFFKGSRVAEGPVYIIHRLNMNSTGNYTCVAYNNVTEKNSTAFKELTVSEPVTSATVTVMGSQPIENQPFNLTCDTSGTVYSIKWLRNDLAIFPNNRMPFSLDNRSISFHPVERSDNGNYQCIASNTFSSKTSAKYTLLVNYGPERVSIFGPSEAKKGSNVTFSCSASSQPPSHYSWFFKGSRVAEGSVYTMHDLTLDNKGNYICMAYNNITHRNSTASKELTVKDSAVALLHDMCGFTLMVLIGLSFSGVPFTF